MTSVEMLARLRSLLDETPEGFWTDDLDCYPALTIAQLEVIKNIAPYKSIALRTILARAVQASKSFTTVTGLSLPGDFYLMYSIKANATGGTEHPAHERILRNDFEDNPYMNSEADRLYYTISGKDNALKIFFETDFANGSITMDYISKPEDITASVDHELDGIAHAAIVYSAFGYLLLKAKLPATNALQLYDATIKTLI